MEKNRPVARRIDAALRALKNGPGPAGQDDTGSLVEEKAALAGLNLADPKDRARMLGVVLAAVFDPPPPGIAKRMTAAWYCRFLARFLDVRPKVSSDLKACELIKATYPADYPSASSASLRQYVKIVIDPDLIEKMRRVDPEVADRWSHFVEVRFKERPRRMRKTTKKTLAKRTAARSKKAKRRTKRR